MTKGQYNTFISPGSGCNAKGQAFGDMAELQTDGLLNLSFKRLGAMCVSIDGDIPGNLVLVTTSKAYSQWSDDQHDPHCYLDF